MLRPLGFLSLSLSGKMNSLSRHVLWTTPSQLLPWWEEKPPSLFTSFYSLTLVYFLSVSSCAKLRLPKTTSPRLCKTSQRPLQRLLNSKPISDFGETLSCKDGGQRESWNTKATQVQTPDSCWNWCNFSLIEKVNASVKYVIDDCSGLCNCTYCCKRGISNSHSLNLILSSLSLFLQRVNVWMLVFMCRLVYMS